MGKTLDGKYRVDGFLKRGGMGAVYRGTHLMLDKPVAIKLIKPELVSSSDVVQRFLREARAAAHLSHPNIVTVHDLGQTSDGTLYIAMELVPGSSLKELIVAGGAWEPKRAVRLLRGISGALALAHREGIVHRDLKPQNIMVTRDSDGNEIPKLLDFGIAKTFEPTSPALTSTGMVLGTPHYMSAEQAKGLPADQRSDLYALGVILYEMLVGKVPFDDTSIPQILIKHLSEPPKPPSAMGANIPKELEAVVLRCLEKEPDDRYQSAEELMVAMNRVPDTAAMDFAAPTLAEIDAPAESTRETTMAGAAAVAALPTPPDVGASTRAPRDTNAASMPSAASSTSTVRAHEVRVPRGSNAPVFMLVGVVVLALALLAFFLLRGGSDAPEVAQTAAAVSEPPPMNPGPSDASSGLVPEPVPESESEPAAPAEPTAADPPPRAEPSSSAPGVVSEAPPPTRPAAEPARRPQAAEPIAPPPPPPPLPEIPVTGFVCDGVRDGCAALRFAVVEECRKLGIPMANRAGGDVLVRVDVEEVEARNEQQFGTTFVVRTYSIDAGGSSPHFDEELVLPPKMISFDARRGREKLQEESRVIASELVDQVRKYWAANRAQ